MYTLLGSKDLTNRTKMHFIGHSLGAHVVGHAARLLKLNGMTVDRITGLDPAEPCFEAGYGKHKRLTREDAKFVDIIHSDGSHTKNGGFGLWEPLGKLHLYFMGIIIF